MSGMVRGEPGVRGAAGWGGGWGGRGQDQSCLADWCRMVLNHLKGEAYDLCAHTRAKSPTHSKSAATINLGKGILSSMEQ